MHERTAIEAQEFGYWAEHDLKLMLPDPRMLRQLSVTIKITEWEAMRDQEWIEVSYLPDVVLWMGKPIFLYGAYEILVPDTREAEPLPMFEAMGYQTPIPQRRLRPQSGTTYSSLGNWKLNKLADAIEMHIMSGKLTQISK